MENKQTVMLGLDFASMRNLPAALYSAQRFMEWAEKSVNKSVMLGVSHSAKRDEFLKDSGDKLLVNEAMQIIACCACTVVFWDNDVTAKADQILEKADIVNCRPYFSAFNYGSALNRLLLLAAISDCRYLMRFDPGTLPPNGISFDDFISEHITKIGDTNCVVSRGYNSRTSLRDTYVFSGEAQAELLEEYTGIVPTRQTTSGAGLTSRVPGIPMLCFDKSPAGLTLIWGTDDAFYQILPETIGSEQLSGFPIERFDPVGKPKLPIEYYRGIAGMVFLANYHLTGDEDLAAVRMSDFLQRLRNDHLDPEKYLPMLTDGQFIGDVFMDEEIAPSEFRKKIVEGYANHQSLLSDDNWLKIVEALNQNTADLPIHL